MVGSCGSPQRGLTEGAQTRDGDGLLYASQRVKRSRQGRNRLYSTPPSLSCTFRYLRSFQKKGA